jgi:hypothetical protein
LNPGTNEQENPQSSPDGAGILWDQRHHLVARRNTDFRKLRICQPPGEKLIEVLSERDAFVNVSSATLRSILW